MTRNYFGKLALLATAGMAVAALVPASASAETFNFATGGSDSSGTYGNVFTFNGNAGTKVEVTGYSLSTNLSSLTTGIVSQYNNYGLGLTANWNDDSHTLDNNGRFDLFVLQFDKIVSVSELGFTAWGDTDITYAIGATVVPFSSTLSIGSYAALDALFGAFTPSNNSNSYWDGQSLTHTVNGANATGNLFLVAASMTNGTNDRLKLKTLTETPVAVPEPATWAMMIGGLGIVGMSMRRRKTAVSFA